MPSGLEGQCLTSISTEVGRDGLTFRLPATAVDSEAVLHITTSGSAEGWSGIAVRWEGDPCRPPPTPADPCRPLPTGG